jgi:hypothetical protein
MVRSELERGESQFTACEEELDNLTLDFVDMCGFASAILSVLATAVRINAG